MNFTISTIAQSLSAYFAPYFPGVTCAEGPNQQGTTPPCMFLQQRYSDIKVQPSGRWLRTIGLDITYLLEYNLPELQAQYQQAAETLDLIMETFPYSDGATEETVLLRTYERKWNIDKDALHYKFELQVWVSQPEAGTPMETMDYQEDVTNGG